MEKNGTKPTMGNLLAEASALILSLVFIYTAGSKLLDMAATRDAFMNQPFPNRIGLGLAYILPATELAVGISLLLPKSRKIAIAFTVVLMALFTGYVATVLTGIFGRIPCSCGGIISTLGWGEHLILNLALLAIAILGYCLEKSGQSKINKEK